VGGDKMDRIELVKVKSRDKIAAIRNLCRVLEEIEDSTADVGMARSVVRQSRLRTTFARPPRAKKESSL